MSEITREVVHDRRGGSGAVAWLALILAVLALVLAWMAYNRTGDNLENRIQQGVNRAAENAPDVDVDVNPGGTDNADTTDGRAR